MFASLFSDRFWILKVGAAAALFVGLSWRSVREFAPLHPTVEQAAVHPEQVGDRTIYTWGSEVVSANANGFDIRTGVGPVHVTSAWQPAEGEYVTLVARAGGPRRIVALQGRVIEGYLWKRGLTYGVSIITVLVYLGLVRHRFRARPSEGIFRSRY